MGSYEPTVWVTIVNRDEDPYYGVPACTYCDEESMLRYTDPNPFLSRLLCHDHYKMHRDDDPWLELIGLVKNA